MTYFEKKFPSKRVKKFWDTKRNLLENGTYVASENAFYKMVLDISFTSEISWKLQFF